MTDLFANPAIQSGAVPFVVALVVAALIGFSGPASARFAGLAVPAGFIAAYVLTLGLPPLVPNSSGQKIFYIALLAGATGLILGTVKDHSGRRALVGIAVSAFAIGWLGWRNLTGEPSPDHIVMALIFGGAAIAFFASERQYQDPADKTVPLLVVGLALAGIAFFGASASLAQNSSAMAAALGAVLVLNWPTRRFGLTVIARLTAIPVFIGLITQLALFTSAPAWISALLIPSLFADKLADRFMPVEDTKAAFWRPVLIGLIAAVPAAVALTAAWYVASASGLSGGY